MRRKIVENYENMSDDEIVTLINNGNPEPIKVILGRYRPVILRYVRDYCSHAYSEDAVQEATLALYFAVCDFDPEKASFSTFATLCIKRSVLSVLNRRQRKKDVPEELISDLEEFEIADVNTPEKIFFDKESYKSLTDTIHRKLSSLEYKTLLLYLSGESYREIAGKLDICEKTVDNAMTRIRKKLRNACG